MANLFHFNAHFDGNFFGEWFATKLLHEAARHLRIFIDRFHHVNRNTDRSRLIGECTCNRLANPPGCIGRKFETFSKVELLNRAEEPDIPLLHQIKQGEIVRSTDILLRDRHYQSEIGFGKPLFCRSITRFHRFGKSHFFLPGNERHTPDFFEIHLHQVR